MAKDVGTNVSYIIVNGSDVIPAENDSQGIVCREDTPYSYELFQRKYRILSIHVTRHIYYYAPVYARTKLLSLGWPFLIF